MTAEEAKWFEATADIELPLKKPKSPLKMKMDLDNFVSDATEIELISSV